VRIVRGRRKEQEVMSKFWYHERTDSGWEVRDENRTLVALVPDAKHEREHDAQRIAEKGPPLPATSLAESKLEDEIAGLRNLVRNLVVTIEADASVLVLRVKTRGPDDVASDELAGHAQELAKAEAALDAKRLLLHETRKLRGGGV
jgi:hypothetical protein